MADDMFFTPDNRSLRRGRRVAERTAVCRPCVVSILDMPDATYHGVVLDINRYGMRIRMLEPLPTDTEVVIQLMKDEDFRVPLARPIYATIARVQEASGLSDHGVRVSRDGKRAAGVRSAAEVPKLPLQATGSRMFTIDMVRRRANRQSGR